MLHSFKFKNLFSFLDETEVSFLVGKHAPCSNLFFEKGGVRATKLLAVLGANGSGKTSLLKPLDFLRYFVAHSFASLKPEDEITIASHFFSDSDDSEFEVIFEIDGEIYKYELVVNGKQVVRESLYVKTSQLYSYLFHREWNGEKDGVDIRQQKFGFLPREAKKVRNNASLISTAAQYNVSCAQKIVDYFDDIFTNVDFIGKDDFVTSDVFGAARYFNENPVIKEKMIGVLCGLDLGLSGLEIEKRNVLLKDGGEEEEVDLPFGIHRSDEKEIKIPFIHESSGTQRTFVLLRKILPALEVGGVVVLDELESDLHPDMLIALLELFINIEYNPYNAQLIFTCHSHEILNILDKTQIVLVEKDENCSSEAWRLDEMKDVRRDDNLYAKYRAGAYGAIPNI